MPISDLHFSDFLLSLFLAEHCNFTLLVAVSHRLINWGGWLCGTAVERRSLDGDYPSLVVDL